MKKLILLFMFLLLIGNVSALNWDNKADYKDNNLTVIITNWFGVGEKLGEAKLSSHKSSTEIREVLPGKDRVVMYYEFTDWNNYENGLGKVIFKNMRNGGKEVVRDYYFAKAIYETQTYPSHKIDCKNVLLGNGTIEKQCTQTKTGDKSLTVIRGWERLNSTEIPTGNTTIGLITEVKSGDYFDGVWTIAGKQVARHAEWIEAYNNNLVDYINFSETGTRFQDNTGNANNATRVGTVSSVAGIIGNGVGFDGTAGQQVYLASNSSDFPKSTEDYTFRLWINPDTITCSGGGGADCGLIYDNGNSAQFSWRIQSDGDFALQVGCGSADIISLIDTWSFTDWAHLVLRRVGSNVTIWKNATIQGEIVCAGSITNTGYYLGTRPQGPNDQLYIGEMDELAISNQSSWSDQRIIDDYNNGVGITHTLEFINEPTVTLNAPANNTDLTINNLTFNCSATDDVGVTQLDLIIDDVVNSSVTNSSAGENLSLEVNVLNIGEGTHDWTCNATDNVEAINGTGALRTFSINTAPDITLIDPTPANNTEQTLDNFVINVSLTETFFDNVTFSVFNSSGEYNATIITSSIRILNYTSVPEGNYTYNVTIRTNTTTSNTSETRQITIDSTAPAINVTLPTINYYIDGNNLTLNWSAVDDNLDKCWFEYNDTNTTVICGDKNTTFAVDNQQNLTFYANDSFGNEGSNFTEWVYIIKEISETFSNSTLEGNTETFTINITINSTTYTNSRASLVYNGTSNTGTKTGSGDSLLFTRDLIIPNVDAQTNLTFYWEIVLNNGTDSPFNSTFHNQTVDVLTVDNCTTNTNVLYNFTIVDEKSQMFLNPTNQNTSGKLNLQIFTLNRNIEVINFTKFYNKTNPFLVCLSTNLSKTNYSIDAEIEYSADSYAKEFYHIQNDTLNRQDLNTNITLFDLDSTNAQEFKITFKDETFLGVVDALIQIQRKYIDEGVFKTVEIPKTDFAGATVANLELNDVKYTFIVLKNGKLLATFADKIAVCNNAAIDDCEINLDSFSSSTGSGDFTQLDDFTFTLDYNRTSRVITSIFTVPSGSLSTVALNATLFDGLGNRSVCDDILTSSSGTLTCTVPSTFGNGSVVVTIEKDGVEVGGGITSLAQSSVDIYGSNLAFLSIFILLTLIGIGISSSPMVTGLFLTLGLILNIRLNLMDTGINSFIGAGATILWLFIAVLIFLIKGQKRG